MDVTRHVTRRDGRREGEPDVEPSATRGAAQAMKDAQRDLTSLSGPPPRARGNARESTDSSVGDANPPA